MENSESLSQKFIKGSTWQTASTIVQVISNFIGMIVLARLLDPGDFGVFAAIQVIAGIVSMFSNLGIASALIQHKEISPRHIEVGFSSSLILSFTVFICLWVLAPFFPSLFHSNFDIWMVRVNALVFPILGWSMVSSSLLTRKLDFKGLFISSFCSMILGSSLVTILFAFIGFGAWSLVFGTVSSAIISTICLSILSPHSRKLGLPKKEVQDLFSFGGMYTILRVINYLSTKADNFVVGRWMGIETLGLYDRAFLVMSYPGVYIGNIIDAVTFPTLAKIQDETDKLKKAYLQGIKLASFLLLPLSTFFVIYSYEIVEVLLGHKWIQITPTLQILFLVITFRTTSRVCDSLARAKGALIQNTIQKIIYLSLVILGSLIGKAAGLTGVAIGIDIAVFIHYLLMANLGLKLTEGSIGEFLYAQKPGLVFMFIFMLICYPLSSFLRYFSLNAIFILFISFITIIVTVTLLVFSFPKLIDRDIRYWINATIQSLKLTKFTDRVTKHKLYEL